MTINAEPDGEDAFWRRPADGDTVAAPQPSAEPSPEQRPYAGPPRGTPPPPGWRPPVVSLPPEPRRLPAQDHDVLDAQEQAATTITNGIALISCAVMFVLMAVLCGRWML